MRNILISLIPSSILLLFLSTPITLAAGLVQCDESDPASCSLCALFQTIDAVYDKATEITIVLAAGYTIWGGFELLMAGANPALHAKGVKRIRSAFIGVFIVLAAWFLVNAFITTLISGSTEGNALIEVWNSPTCK